MDHIHRAMIATVALTLGTSSAAFAQSSPMPMATPASSATMAPTTSMPSATSAPATTAPATSAPATATSAPATDTTSAPRSSLPGTRNTNVDGANIKKIKAGTLTRSQVVYGLTHQVQAAKQLAKMKTIKFDNLRVYKLPTSLQSLIKVSDADSSAMVTALLGPGVLVAQTTPSLPATNGNNSPIQYLRDVLANINVSNALNNLNVLNNSNVNLNVALSNVLNNNKISIGQVVGLYIGGGGIITTITK